MHKPSDTLRKAAILVWSLDSAGADKLLDQMPPEQAARVRQAVLDLGSIDPAEQQEVIDEFLGRKQAVAEPGGVELDASLVRKFSSPAASETPQPTPFRCLHEATPETLARFLQREHPQTVALVVAHLPPTRAAEIVARLTAPFQADVLQRVADLDETNPEVIRELEQSLADLLADELRAGRRRTAGLAAVGAILNAANATSREGMLSNLAHTDSDLASRLAPGQSGPEKSKEPDSQRTLRSSFFWKRPASPAPAKVAGTLRVPWPVVQDSHTDDDFEAEPQGDEPQTDDTELEDPEITSRLSTPAVEFDDFSHFNNAALVAVLKAADPRITILALTGARKELVDRLLLQLPRKEAKALRKRLEQSGPLRLRDVETAQRQLAALAGRLAAQGILTLPVIRRFAMAA